MPFSELKPARPSRKSAVLWVALAALVLAAVWAWGPLSFRRNEPPPQITPSLQTVPMPARQAQFERLIFDDDFDSESTIDVKSSGNERFKWFVDLPFRWPDPHAQVSVRDSVLTINARAGTYNNGNWSLSTKSPGSRAGRTFKYGYFESRLRFGPQSNGKSGGWPAFWAISERRVLEESDARYAELDFFEVAGKRFNGTVHDWVEPPSGSKVKSRMNSATHLSEIEYNFSEWHTVSCLWEPGRVSWYIDESMIIEQYYSDQAEPFPNNERHPRGTYSSLDYDPLMVVLGTGEGWPLEVDWVRIWR